MWVFQFMKNGFMVSFVLRLLKILFAGKSLWAEMGSAPTDFLLFFVENENDQKIKMMIDGFG